MTFDLPNSLQFEFIWLAASIVPSSKLSAEWFPISVMPAVVNALRPIPAPPNVVAHGKLATTAMELAHTLRAALREMGFDHISVSGWIRDTVAEAGGTLLVDSLIGRGTRIELSLPRR